VQAIDWKHSKMKCIDGDVKPYSLLTIVTWIQSLVLHVKMVTFTVGHQLMHLLQWEDLCCSA